MSDQPSTVLDTEAQQFEGAMTGMEALVDAAVSMGVLPKCEFSTVLTSITPEQRRKLQRIGHPAIAGPHASDLFYALPAKIRGKILRMAMIPDAKRIRTSNWSLKTQLEEYELSQKTLFTFLQLAKYKHAMGPVFLQKTLYQVTLLLWHVRERYQVFLKYGSVSCPQYNDCAEHQKIEMQLIRTLAGKDCPTWKKGLLVLKERVPKPV